MFDAYDELFDLALNIVVSAAKASPNLLVRKLSIGSARAARIIDEMEEAGFVGPSRGNKPREVLVTAEGVTSFIKSWEEEKNQRQLAKAHDEKQIKEFYEKEAIKYKDYDHTVFFPWPDVSACLNEKSSKHVYRTADDFKNDPKHKDIKCTGCNRGLDSLDVIYFKSPDWTWWKLAGRMGWLVLCDKCKKQVYFEAEVMN